MPLEHPQTPRRAGQPQRLVCLIPALLVFAAALLLSLSAQARETRADTRPAFWTVSDADTTLYLFGSIHVLRPQDKWRFPAFSDALAQSKAVYFEAPTDMFSQASAAFLVARLGLNPTGKTLSSQISPESRSRLRRLARRYGLALDSLEPMRPWYAFLTLSAAAAAEFGASPSYGVDAVVESDARRVGKEIRTFETLEQQLRIFADMAPATEAKILEAALLDLEQNPDQFDALLTAWLTADLAAMERLAFDSMRKAPPALLQRVYLQRNLDWVETLDAMMQREQGAYLAVVGAAHLLGEQSVQNLLEQKGYFVSRR